MLSDAFACDDLSHRMYTFASCKIVTPDDLKLQTILTCVTMIGTEMHDIDAYCIMNMHC